MTGHTDVVAQDFIVIHVVARPNRFFASYDLLQAISATGMQFGAMNLFHYYAPERMDKNPFFSLASATESGEFDLDRMGDFSCKGLTLFMNSRQVPNREEAFELMLSTAEQLAEDLQGELRAGNKEIWSEEIKKQSLLKLRNS